MTKHLWSALFLCMVMMTAKPVWALPLDLVMVLDNSGSMKINDPKHSLNKALSEFTQQLPPSTRVALVVFDQGVRIPNGFLQIPLHLNTVTNNINKFLDYRGMWTRIPDAVERAVSLHKEARQYGQRKAILLVTDGRVESGDRLRDVEKSRWLREELAGQAASKGVGIFGVAFSLETDLELVQALSYRTGGDYFFASDAQSLQEAFQRMLPLLAKWGEKPAATVSAMTPTSENRTVAGQNGGSVPPKAVEPPPPPTVVKAVEPPPPPPVVKAVETPPPPPVVKAVEPPPPPPVVKAVEPPPAPPPVQLKTTPPAPPPVAVKVETPLPVQQTTSNKTMEQGEEMPQSSSYLYWIVLALVAGMLSWPWVKKQDWLKKLRLIEEEPVPPVRPKPVAFNPITNEPMFDPDATMLRSKGAASLPVNSSPPIPHAEGGVSTQRETLPPATTLTPAVLVDITGITERKIIPLNGVLFSIGRQMDGDLAEEQQLVIPERAISRKHARITLRNNSHWLEDLNSLNGTFLNDLKINGMVRLVAGDRIRVDLYAFEYRTTSESAKTEEEDILNLT